MENLLTKFFDDNSVCIGLCDLKRKIEIKQINYYAQQPYANIGMPVNTSKQTQSMPQPVRMQQTQAKPQRQSLAQIFAAQQQAYAAQQAYNAQQHTQQFRANMQQAQNKTVQNVQNIARNSNNQAFQSKVIVNGNMKKVISAAVPARY